jgi:hypothetical protein
MVEKQPDEERQRHNSFVLRIWWEDQEDSGFWRGWVQHATTGEAVYVKTLDELVAFIETKTGTLAETEP